MKPINRFIKGTFISLMLAMMLNLGAGFLGSSAGTIMVPEAYAEVDFDAAVGNMKPVEEMPKDATAVSDMLDKAAKWANWGHAFFAPLINFFSFHIGNFLGTDYIFNDKMGEILHKIWVISRNLVNIAFVFILLWLALNTIFNPGFPLDDLKKKLLFFALLLVGVNFSWLGTRIVLDAANVTTHAVFAIPSGISSPPTANSPCEINGPDELARGSCYPTTIIAPADSGSQPPLIWEDKEGDSDNCAKAKAAYQGSDDSAYLADGTINAKTDTNLTEASEKNKKFQRRMSICMENLNLVNYNQNTAVIYLTYGMARIQNLIAPVGKGNPANLAVSVLMSYSIQLAYAVSLLALFLALIVRTAILWLFVAFSPFLVLLIWFKGKEDVDLGEGQFKFGIREFANWAFVPAKVGAVFAISFIMISAGQAVGEVNFSIFDKLQSATGGGVYSIPDVKTLYAGIGSLNQFIWLLMSLVVLWMGVFGVLGKMSIIKLFTHKIKTAGTELFKVVAELPYKAPILPLGKGGEKIGIKAAYDQYGPVGRLRKWYGEDREVDDTRKLTRNAKTPEAQQAVRYAVKNGIEKQADANRLAEAFGFKLRDLMLMKPDALREAFKDAGAKPEEASEIYDALKRFEQEQPKGAPTPVTPKPAAVLPTGVPPAVPPGTAPAPEPTAKPPAPPAQPTTP
ncbi:MAG: hypothetical protein V1880_04495 [Patescibacteria group bacterium]